MSDNNAMKAGKSEAMYTSTDLLHDWLRRAVISLDAHYDAARHYTRYNYWIGVPAAILSSFVGTTVFVGLGTNIPDVWQYLIAFSSLGAAILTTLHTFLRFSERVEKHRQIAARYGAVIREVEQLLTLPIESWSNNTSLLEGIRRRLDSLSEDSPSIPYRFIEEARKRHPINQTLSSKE